MAELVRKTDELADIVKRLLEGADYAWDTEAMTAAADEITHLRAENERLRAALRKVVHDWEIPQDDNWKRVFRSVWEIARAALAAQPAPSNTGDTK